MKEQEEWRDMRRPAAPAAPQAAPTASNRSQTAALMSSRAAGACSPRARRGTSHKADDAAAPGRNAAAQAPASRWRELRQSVRIKATRGAVALQPNAVRIADLCDEDREKVAKLVRRLVEVASRHEEAEKKLTSQRRESETQLQELRESATRDAHELGELRDALQAARREATRLQKRVRRLEAATDAETRRRLDAEQALERMKLQADQLHALVRDQREEMRDQAERQQRQGDAELQRVGEQLREAQERLLQERQDRVQEKHKELQQRLDGCTLASGSGGGLRAVEEVARLQLDASSFLNSSCELPEKMQEILDGWKQRVEDAVTAAATGVSGQTRAVQTETTEVRTSASMASVACQTGGRGVQEQVQVQAVQAGNDSEYEKEVTMGGGEENSNTSGASESVEASRTTSEVAEGFVTPVKSRQRRLLHQQDVPKVRRLDFDQFISALGSDSDVSKTSDAVGVQSDEDREVIHDREDVQRRESRPESLETRAKSALPRPGDGFQAFRASFESNSRVENVMDDGFERNQRQTELATPRVVDQSFGGMYESSLFDVVEAVERAQKSSRSSVDESGLEEKAPRLSDEFQRSIRRSSHLDSPSTRVEDLRKQLEARERALYGPNGATPRRYESTETVDIPERAFRVEWDGLAAFEDVKELYAEELFASRRWGPSTNAGRKAEAGDPPLVPEQEQLGVELERRDSDAPAGASLSTQELSVREAIERDMEALLRSESLRSLALGQQ